jgi:hypothetical protein
VRPRASLTERARREACRLVGEDGLDVAAVADLLGVAWSTIIRAVAEYGQPLVENPTRLAGVVSVDETAFLAAGPRSATRFVTGIVALPGPGRARAQLLDVVPGRSNQKLQFRSGSTGATRPGGRRSGRPPRHPHRSRPAPPLAPPRRPPP